MIGIGDDGNENIENGADEERDKGVQVADEKIKTIQNRRGEKNTTKKSLHSAPHRKYYPEFVKCVLAKNQTNPKKS